MTTIETLWYIFHQPQGPDARELMRLYPDQFHWTEAQLAAMTSLCKGCDKKVPDREIYHQLCYECLNRFFAAGNDNKQD